jgi:hypothetical protein
VRTVVVARRATSGHYALVSRLVDDFASSHNDDVIQRGGETFIAAERVGDLIDAAEQQHVRVLGLEGFIINDVTVYPALSRIADFSHDTPETATRRARELLTGTWAKSPTSDDQLHSEAIGRHMIAVVLDD